MNAEILFDMTILKIRLDREIGKLLIRAEAACSAGFEPEASLVTAIRWHIEKAEVLTLDVAQALLQPEEDEWREAIREAFGEAMVASLIAYGRNPNEDTYGEITDVIIAWLKRYPGVLDHDSGIDDVQQR